MNEKVLYIYDDVFLGHETGTHPEKKERLSAIHRYLKSSDVWAHIKQENPRQATDKEIGAIHTQQYIDHVSQVIGSRMGFLDSMDTVVSPGSLKTAYHAAGAGLTAADSIMSGQSRTAFCAVRPPGHHAEADQSMGFCIFNNIAVTARYLQNQYNLEKILILDWDVHHGNATEHSFYDDDSVFFVSLHQYPHYPGTGAGADIGQGKGRGYTKNFPMPAGSGDQEYLQRMQQIKKMIQEYKPDFILISSGFDAHARDPLAGINLSSEVFFDFTQIVQSAADAAQGRIISFLEGGYDLQAIGESAYHHLKSLSSFGSV